MTKPLQKVRVYTKPSPVMFCLNCSSVAHDKETNQFRCMEFPDEVKVIDGIRLFSDPSKLFPDFCPLKEMSRKQFEKKRGW
jgi:hypothetical protein